MNNCPLVTNCNLGNCDLCEEKADCILLAILSRLESLEQRLILKDRQLTESIK